MLRSGIQTDEAISLLQHGGEPTGGVLEHGLAVMKEQVDQGSGLASAMESSGIFPRYALQMIAAGERFGRLEDILFRLSDYYAQQKTISEKLRGAVTYPLLSVLIIAVLAVMLSMVLPAFTTSITT